MESPLRAVVRPVQQLLPPGLLAQPHPLVQLDLGRVGLRHAAQQATKTDVHDSMVGRDTDVHEWQESPRS